MLAADAPTTMAAPTPTAAPATVAVPTPAPAGAGEGAWPFHRMCLAFSASESACHRCPNCLIQLLLRSPLGSPLLVDAFAAAQADVLAAFKSEVNLVVLCGQGAGVVAASDEHGTEKLLTAIAGNVVYTDNLDELKRVLMMSVARTALSVLRNQSSVATEPVQRWRSGSEWSCPRRPARRTKRAARCTTQSMRPVASAIGGGTPQAHLVPF